MNNLPSSTGKTYPSELAKGGFGGGGGANATHVKTTVDPGLIHAEQPGKELGRSGMPLGEGGSVTRWIGELREGDPAAAGAVWERYFDRLVRLRKRLAGRAWRGRG